MSEIKVTFVPFWEIIRVFLITIYRIMYTFAPIKKHLFFTKKHKNMKKFVFKSMLCLTLGAVTMTSCVGSFGLFNKLLAWNKNLSNKFVNELVFIVISPAYGICSLADLVVLNSVEFWTGKNPISKVGTTKNVWGQDGRQYAVKTLKNGYEITEPTGEKTLFVYNKSEKSWSMESNGKVQELFRFNEDGTVQACLPNGEKMDVALNEGGMYQLRMAVNDGTFFAAR